MEFGVGELPSGVAFVVHDDLDGHDRSPSRGERRRRPFAVSENLPGASTKKGAAPLKCSVTVRSGIARAVRESHVAVTPCTFSVPDYRI
jgi:hypothetical protein